jgi:cyclin-dependent kinase-like
MESYEVIEVIGEGTYGHVYKAVHKPTGIIVAIKKFKDCENEDEHVKKTALREISALNSLSHDNIVKLFEVFRDDGKICLIFEYVDHTVLQDIDITPQGLPTERVRKLMYQMLKSVKHMHDHNYIHRDIKPENLLISKNGILKLCDFGFARELMHHYTGAILTDYVSTRWYRAPELLVGDAKYSRAVDIWSIGCIFAEIYNGQPLFPGESDIDTLHHILRSLGNNMTSKQKKSFKKNALFYGVKLPRAGGFRGLDKLVPEMGQLELDLLAKMLSYEPRERMDAVTFIDHPYFDSIRKNIELEIIDLSELDKEDFDLFNSKRQVAKAEKVILDAATEFREQERLNSSYKHQQRGSNIDESDYQSSDEDDRLEYDNDKRSELDNQSDIDLVAQSNLIEDFFNTDSPDATRNFPLEIKEELSESSEDSYKKRSILKVYQGKENSNTLNNSKHLTETNSAIHVTPEILKFKSFDNNKLKSKKEEGIIQSTLSDGIQPISKMEGQSSQVKSHLEAASLLIKDTSTKQMSENPYSDSKLKTSYVWNNDKDVFKAFKGPQNLSSVKKK